MPELRAPDGEYDPNWADKTTTFERVRDMLPPAPPAGGEHTRQQPPDEDAAPRGGDPVRGWRAPRRV